MTPDDDLVLYSVADHIATVTLHCPEARNGWSIPMEHRYFAALDTAEADPDVRVIVVTGHGASFCPGLDIARLAGVARDGLVREGRRHPHYALQIRKPMIAAINGAVAGVGLVQALVCDMRFAARGARISTSFARRGLSAEYGMSWILPRLVGATRAADLLLSGRVFTPAETEPWGLWNGVEPDGETTLARAMSYAEHLANGVGPTALATTKQQLYRDLLHDSPAEAIHDAQRLLAEAMGTAEYREGVAALREKRAPRFG
jgi:enoyl-CoA hydratase/carnithine racemase